MQFRPCIDIHNGQVKQIVGGSLKDAGNLATENYVSREGGAYYAKLYQSMGITGGHIILLNPESSDYYEATKAQAMEALRAYPGGLQVGGGINPDNALQFLEAGASHVIVTSYVFKDGKVNYENLEHMAKAVGPEHLVLDLSCRMKDGKYMIVTDRWQKFTDVELTKQVFLDLCSYCDEFLLHAVDVEGKASGIDENLVRMLASAKGEKQVTYAGGVGSYENLWQLKRAGADQVNVTIGSALDLFGGKLDFEQVLQICREAL